MSKKPIDIDRLLKSSLSPFFESARSLMNMEFSRGSNLPSSDMLSESFCLPIAGSLP